MEAARAAVSKITGKTGHRTDVDEQVNPAVTSETVKPHRHEETTEAIDREVHQHHYHTTVQPVSHQETLPEKHHHNLIPQVEREFKHDNEAETHRRVQTELGQFRDTSTTHQTTQSQVAAPAVTGEHVHHHVHETVQPVIHKETIQPEVVHTTVPIHETHHAQAQHHGLSALPMKTLDEFKTAGGILTGNTGHTHEEYEGAPRPYNDKFSTTIEKVLPGHHGHSGTTGTTGTHGTHGTSNIGGISSGNNTTSGIGERGYNDRSLDNRGGPIGSSDVRSGLGNTTTTTNTTTNTTSSIGGRGVGQSGVGQTGVGQSGVGSLGSSGRPDSGVGGVGSGYNKPTTADKLNPRIDADRDGKAGVMD